MGRGLGGERMEGWGGESVGRGERWEGRGLGWERVGTGEGRALGGERVGTGEDGRVGRGEGGEGRVWGGERVGRGEDGRVGRGEGGEGRGERERGVRSWDRGMVYGEKGESQREEYGRTGEIKGGCGVGAGGGRGWKEKGQYHKCILCKHREMEKPPHNIFRCPYWVTIIYGDGQFPHY